MATQRSFIESSLAQISDRLGHVPLLRGSDQVEEIDKIDELVGSAENEIGKFLSMVNKREGEAFEERLNGLRVRLEELKTPKEVRASSTSSLFPKKQTGKFLQVAAKEGDRLISEQKNATKRIIGVISQMNDEINVIEKEIWVQREKLAMTRDRISESQAFLLQTKRAMSFFAKTLYQDAIIKILIGVIVLAIIAIFVSSALYSRKKNIITIEINRQKEEYRAVDYTEMDDAFFKNAYLEIQAGSPADSVDKNGPKSPDAKKIAESPQLEEEEQVPPEEKVSAPAELLREEQSAVGTQARAVGEEKENRIPEDESVVVGERKETQVQPTENSLGGLDSQSAQEPDSLPKDLRSQSLEEAANGLSGPLSDGQHDLNESSAQPQQQGSGGFDRAQVDDGDSVPETKKI